MEELKEKTWELDTSTRNNLVFYGIVEEDGPGNVEWSVREVIRKMMQISREMPFVKVVRGTGEAVRGSRPITVQFERYQVVLYINTPHGVQIFFSLSRTKPVFFRSRGSYGEPTYWSLRTFRRKSRNRDNI